MGTGGLSEERLERLHEVMAGYVERGVAPGIVALVSRGGERTSLSLARRPLVATSRCRGTRSFASPR